MSYQKGEIYFVHEATDIKGTRSPFIKIGLVSYKNDKRNSFQRLTEHQTGNPRRLYLVPDQIVETEAVQIVELRLHKYFAEHRVSGEWFNFPTDELLHSAIIQAKSFRDEVQREIPVITEASNLSKTISNGLTKTASNEDFYNLKKLLEAKSKIKEIVNLDTQIKKHLTRAAERNVNLEAVVKTIVRKYEPVFDKSTFKKENPELWTSYLVEKPKVMQSKFLLKEKPKQEHITDDDFRSEILRIQHELDSIESDSDVLKIAELNPVLIRLKGEATWDEDLAMARLKVSIGECDELEGVCTWKRALKKVYVLNVGQLEIDHPEVVRRYILNKEAKKIFRRPN